jgi:serine/threonine-protein kinase
MSPEQARGLRGVDHRSDLWSVGVITYRCLVGQLPFEGEAVGDLLVKICTAPLPVPSALAPDVPPGFDAWFTRALAREPNERFSNAAELAQALMATCGLTPPASSLGGPVSPVVTSTAGTAIPASLRTTERAVPGMTASGVTTQSAGTAVQRKPAALIAMVLGVMVLLLIGIIAVVKFSRSGGAAESAPPSSEPGANTQPALAAPAAAPAATSAGPLSTQSAQAPSVQPVQAAAPSASAEMAAPKRAALTPKPQATAESSLSSPQKPRVKPKSGQAKSKEAIDVGY